MDSFFDTDFSLLLWLLATLVAALAVHLSQGWVRWAQRGPGLRQQWRALLLAAGVLGAGLTSATVLCMQAQPLPFPVGYRALAALGLWLGATLVCLPLVALPARVQRGWVLLGVGALLALLALGLQAGWVWAAGMRPGVLWRHELVAAAAVLLIIGLALAQWLAQAAAIQASERRMVWRMAAALLAALTLMAGQQVMTAAAALSTQRGSLFHDQLAGTVLSLVCGVLVPLVLATMALDLWLRKKQTHRGEGGVYPHQRRKRRQRIRTL